MRLSDTPLIDEEAIRQRVAELAGTISRDYAGKNLVMVVILKGAILFASDLAREMSVPVHFEFIRARSYQGVASSGTVDITVAPEISLRDRHVLIVEDILDTGRTTGVIIERLLRDEPASIATCALLNKPSRRERTVPEDYVGFTVEDHFVVGYGMDYDEKYRDLPAIHVMEAAEPTRPG